MFWNLEKTGGWNRYQVLSDKCSEALNDVIDDNSKSVEEVNLKFDQIHNKIKFRCFGKVTLAGKKTKKERSKISIENEEKQAKDLLEIQIKEVEKEIEEIKMMKTGTVGKIYEVARRVRHGKKAAIQPTAVLNPKTGRLAVTKQEIKSCSLQYCNIPDT